MDPTGRQLHIDHRIELYENYLPDDWAEKVGNTVASAPILEQMLIDLILAWRAIAYTASMPGMLIKALQASTSSYANFVSPDMTLVSTIDAIVAKLSRKIPELVDDRSLRSRITAELAIIADEFRAAEAALTHEVPIEPIWKDFLKTAAFRMSVWSSQRVTYVAFYNAYEAFLIDCTKQALGVNSLRTQATEFKEGLRSGFASDIFYPCWTHAELNNARLVRHALSHAGGRETEDLKKQRHGIKLLTGVLQIVPSDNHHLLQRLREAVDALVAVAVVHPRFA